MTVPTPSSICLSFDLALVPLRIVGDAPSGSVSLTGKLSCAPEACRFPSEGPPECLCTVFVRRVSFLNRAVEQWVWRADLKGDTRN